MMTTEDKGKTLLIVDPDHDARQSFIRLSGRLPVKTLTAGSIPEATYFMKEYPISLIVIDVFLSKGNSLPWISEITSRDSHPPIIATYSNTKASKAKANIKNLIRLLGVSCMYEKPVNPEVFQ